MSIFGQSHDDIRTKTLITIWAEERSRLIEGKHQWSFGDGLVSTGDYGGYTMTAPGKLLRMGLSLGSPGLAAVMVVINGKEQSSFSVSKGPNQNSSTVVFQTPLDVKKGDRIKFITKTASPRMYGAIVSLLIEVIL